MDKVFIYWDNSNIFHSAQEVAEQRNGDSDAYHRLRIHFSNMYRLASANRTVVRAIAAGSIPPDMESLWNRLEGQGVDVDKFTRGETDRSEQEVPDTRLQNAMFHDAIAHKGEPGVITLLTGDGRGYDKGVGFFKTIEDIHSLELGWGIELLSWNHTCHERMKNWVQENGEFISLDDYYESVTYLKRYEDDPFDLELRFRATNLDLSARPMS